MTSILFPALVVLSAAAIGAGTLSVFIGLRSGIRLLQWKAVAHLGMLIPVGVILWRVLPQRSVSPGTAAWLYLAGLLIAAIGSIGAVTASIRLEISMRFPDLDERGNHE